MFCTNCGKNIPDGSAFCTGCGAAQATTQPSAPVAQPSQSVPNYQPAPQSYTPVSQPAPQPSAPNKVMKLLPLILSAVCAIALIISYFGFMGTSIEKIPAFSLIGDLADDMEEAKYSMGELYYDAYDEYMDIEDDLTSKEKKALEETLDAMKATSKKISIKNLKKLIRAAENLADQEFEDLNGNYFSELGDISEMDEAMAIFNTFSTIVLIFMLICLALCGCGGFFKIKGLVIAGTIVSALYSLIFCGILYMLLLAAIDVALIIFIDKAKAPAAA